MNTNTNTNANANININMNVVTKLDQFNENYLHFCDPIKNNIMGEGNFIRILYSTPLFSLNGVYLFFPMNDVIVEKYYNKYKCSFSIPNHRNICERITDIEDALLRKVNVKNKAPQRKIYEQLLNGNIKLFGEMVPKQQNMGFLLKISGVWETSSQYGVTYKFTKVDTL